MADATRAPSSPAPSSPAPASDMPATSWIDRLVPAAVRPYLRLARLDRPIGTWLLLFPCWWAVALASPGWPDPWLLALFAVGALAMRGAGCTVNDLVDRDLDRRVARTAARPLASGAIGVRGALVFLALQLLVGLAVLVQFNGITIALALAATPLIVLYPFAKRVTDWPQAVLGLVFNWGALVGWTAATGRLDLPALALYVACLFWTLGYDTIYAHQDKTDDAQVGIRSSALRLGTRSRAAVAAFYGLAVLGLGLAGWLAAAAWPYYAGVGLAALQLGWQAARVDFDDPADCLTNFRSNRLAGWLVFAGAVAASVLAGA